MNKNINIKLVYLILLVLASLAIGFYIGRSTINYDTTIETKPLPERPIEPPIVNDSIDKPIITVPDNPDLPDHILKPKKEEIKYIYITTIKDNADSITYYKYIIDSLSHKIFMLEINSKSIVPDNVDIDNLYTDYISKIDIKNKVMYDNEFGKYTVSYVVQYNRLQEFYNTKIEPVETIVTQTYEKKYKPFVIAGYNTSDFINAGAGILLNRSNVGIIYSYQHDIRKNNIIDRSGHNINIIKSF